MIQSIAIRHQNINLIARTTFESSNPIPIGSATISQPFKDALKANPQSGSYTSDASSTDPITRIYSYQRSSKYHYLINVGLATEVALSGWRNQLTAVSLIITLFTLCLLYLARKIDLAWQQYDIAIENLKHSAAQRN